MHYIIDKNGIQPNNQELEAIDTRLSLALLRFNSIITKCEVSFIPEKSVLGTNTICCSVCVSIIKTSDFVASDSANTISEAFDVVLGRVKRKIERHLKRIRPKRMSATLRTNIH